MPQKRPVHYIGSKNNDDCVVISSSLPAKKVRQPLQPLSINQLGIKRQHHDDHHEDNDDSGTYETWPEDDNDDDEEFFSTLRQNAEAINNELEDLADTFIVGADDATDEDVADDDLEQEDEVVVSATSTSLDFPELGDADKEIPANPNFVCLPEAVSAAT